MTILKTLGVTILHALTSEQGRKLEFALARYVFYAVAAKYGIDHS